MASIAELVAGLALDDQIAAYRARQELSQTVWRAGADHVEQKRVSDELSTELEKPHPTAAREEVCRQLSLVGDDAAVEALARTVSATHELREAARWALGRIPAHKATAVLVSLAINQRAAADLRIGAIHSLARRNDPQGTTALVRCAGDAEPEIALAALEALATLPDAATDALLAKALESSEGRATARLLRARVRLGDRLLADGQRDAAKAVFQALAAGAESPQQQAAVRALAEIG